MDRTKRLAAALICFAIVITALPFTALSTEVEFRNRAPYSIEVWPQACGILSAFTLSPGRTKEITVDNCAAMGVRHRKTGDPGWNNYYEAYPLWTSGHPKYNGVVWTLQKGTSDYEPQWSDR